MHASTWVTSTPMARMKHDGRCVGEVVVVVVVVVVATYRVSLQRMLPCLR